MTTPDHSSESPVWSGTPSQWLNFGTFLACGVVAVAFIVGAMLWSRAEIAAVALVPAAFAFWKWLTVRCTRIEVTTERVTVQTGVFSRHRWDMELYRVKDTTLHEPFLLRIVGLGNVALESSDKTTPRLVIPAVRSAESLRQQLRTNVERMRMARRVRELDFE